jgi:hypothetical protein
MGTLSRRPGPLGVGTILLISAAALWVITFGYMWIPDYVFHSAGPRYALWPIGLLTEVVVLGLAISGLVAAIVGAARGRIGPGQTTVAVVLGMLLIALGPPLLWFGTIPLLSPAAFNL